MATETDRGRALFEAWVSTDEVAQRVANLRPKYAKEFKEAAAKLAQDRARLLHEYFAGARDMQEARRASVRELGAGMVSVLQSGIDRVNARVAAANADGAPFEAVKGLLAFFPLAANSGYGIHWDNSWDVTGAPFFATPELNQSFNELQKEFRKKVYKRPSRGAVVDPAESYEAYVHHANKTSAIEEKDEDNLREDLNRLLVKYVTMYSIKRKATE